jgi:hypothetical protein
MRWFSSNRAQVVSGDDRSGDDPRSTMPQARSRIPDEMTDWMNRHRVLASVGIVLVAIILLSAIAGHSSKSTPIKDRASGHMGHSSLGVFGSNSTAFGHLSTSNVYCGWRGSHVVVHAVFTNSYGSGVKLDISPAYTLRNAGEHGDSEDLHEEVPAGKTVTWIGDAGSPEGSPEPGTRITDCSPEIESVDLG